MKLIFSKLSLLLTVLLMSLIVADAAAQGPSMAKRKSFGSMGIDTAAASGSITTIYFYPGLNELTPDSTQFHFPGFGTLSTGIVLDSLSGAGNGATVSVTAQLQVSNAATAPDDSDESWMDLSGTNATITQNGSTTTQGPYYTTSDFTYRWFRWKVSTAATTISIEALPWYQWKDR